MLDVVLAMAVFAIGATGFAVAMHRMGESAYLVQREMRITRVLDTALNEKLSLPVLTAGETSQLTENGEVELITLIEELDGLENEEGTPLAEMYLIRITARWYEDGQWIEREVETWRYGRLYQP
ncbi:MAG: hypothetical protein R3242_07425 [Akkermansiaceae bacterium]|nr:hypothetical protein [Akkermansiaceae bacterium]